MMKDTSPINGTRAWLMRRLVNNYWSLSILAVITAVPVSLAILWLDRNGLTDALIENELVLVASAPTAQDFAGIAAGISATFISLYFSITLIVISLAAGSLSARLIDRWLDKQLVRVSIATLSFSLVISLATLLATDGDTTLVYVPLGLISFTFFLQLVNLAVLAISLQDLGRTMFVDRSIAELQQGASSPPIVTIASKPRKSSEWHPILRSKREGYVQGIDLKTISETLSDVDGVLVCVAPGQHVMHGEALLCATSTQSDVAGLHDTIAIDTFRSDAQGAVFRIRLLVEIAARALSPGINDFYTALACIDAIAVAMRGHRDSWTASDEVPSWSEDHRIELPGQDFASLFGNPLTALRQSSSEYPIVTMRLIGNFRKLAEAEIECGAWNEDYVAYLLRRAKEFHDHAIKRADLELDRDTIASRLTDFEDMVRQATR